MIDLEVLCRSCRRTYIPTRADVVAGVWRLCPRCRDGPAAEDPRAISPPTSGSQANLEPHPTTKTGEPTP
jgi:hypothetical protein